MITRKQLEAREKKLLAGYAVLSSSSRGRIYREKEDDVRTCFQRDRDRIIHSKAFRRLAGKTQVFVAVYGDHYRDRLSHTLEMAQISRALARTLAVNEDLAEAIALAHDLGHTPFGHAGEHTLNKLMKRFGMGFEHNEQSKRIVEILEDRYPNFPGLNLSYEVLQGLEKHQSHYDQRGRKISGKTVEAQIVDLADEIAYHNHDLDDGLRSKLFRIEDLRKLNIFKIAERKVRAVYGRKIDVKFLRHRAISFIVHLMMRDVVAETERRIKRYKIKTARDVVTCATQIVGFSASFKRHVDELRLFLWNKMYQSKKVLSHSRRGQKILKTLFVRLYNNPRYLPVKLRKRIKSGVDLLPVVVKDYIAGMTDQYAMSKM